jgi:hypothetical protein
LIELERLSADEVLGGSAGRGGGALAPRLAGFYERRGWQTLVAEIEFGAGYTPFVVLGKRLD